MRSGEVNATTRVQPGMGNGNGVLLGMIGDYIAVTMKLLISDGVLWMSLS